MHRILNIYRKSRSGFTKYVYLSQNLAFRPSRANNFVTLEVTVLVPSCFPYKSNLALFTGICDLCQPLWCNFTQVSDIQAIMALLFNILLYVSGHSYMKKDSFTIITTDMCYNVWLKFCIFSLLKETLHREYRTWLFLHK